MFAGDGNSYDVDCETNLEVVSTECTLDGVSYNCKTIASNGSGCIAIAIVSRKLLFSFPVCGLQ